MSQPIISLEEIAEQAGVAVSTVSRALSDHPDISPKTAARIRFVADDMGYVPLPPSGRGRPRKARASSRRTHAVAFFIPDTDSQAMATPLSAALAHGIESALFDHENSMLLTHFRPDAGLPICIEKRQIDGLILRGGQPDKRLEKLVSRFPAVWIFEPSAVVTCDVVMPDNEAIGQIASDHLLGQKYAALAIVSPAEPHAAFQHRRAAFVNALSRKMRSPLEFTISHGTSMDRVASELTALGKRPIGIYCNGHDEFAPLLYKALHSQGLTPGTDFEIIFSSNSPERMWTLDNRFPLLDIQPEELGRIAVERLMLRMANPTSPLRKELVAPALRWATQ